MGFNLEWYLPNMAPPDPEMAPPELLFPGKFDEDLALFVLTFSQAYVRFVGKFGFLLGNVEEFSPLPEKVLLTIFVSVSFLKVIKIQSVSKEISGQPLERLKNMYHAAQGPPQHERVISTKNLFLKVC